MLPRHLSATSSARCRPAAHEYRQRAHLRMLRQISRERNRRQRARQRGVPDVTRLPLGPGLSYRIAGGGRRLFTRSCACSLILAPSGASGLFGLYLKDMGTGGRIITNHRAPALPKPSCSVTYSLDATWRIAADDAPRWVPRGSGSHGPDGVDVAAVAVTPPANRAALHSYSVVPCSRRASR